MPLLLESGDYLLLESGDNLLLEDETATAEVGSVHAGTRASSLSYASTSKGAGMADTVVLGAENVAGFVFLNDSDAVTSPGGVAVTVTAPDGTTTAYTDADAEVTIGDVLPSSLRTDLVNRSNGKVTAAGIADGTGCVSFVHTPTAAGVWWYFCEGTSTVAGAARTYTIVVPIAD